ncbi:hypothetical protein [Nitrosomonas supralitoralis]
MKDALQAAFNAGQQATKNNHKQF